MSLIRSGLSGLGEAGKRESGRRESSRKFAFLDDGERVRVSEGEDGRFFT